MIYIFMFRLLQSKIEAPMTTSSCKAYQKKLITICVLLSLLRIISLFVYSLILEDCYLNQVALIDFILVICIYMKSIHDGIFSIFLSFDVSKSMLNLCILFFLLFSFLMFYKDLKMMSLASASFSYFPVNKIQETKLLVSSKSF